MQLGQLARTTRSSGDHRSKQELDDLIELLQNHCESESFRSALAVVDQKFESLLKKVFADHPGLKEDIADKKQKFGRPI